jgi:hypothetical protein
MHSIPGVLSGSSRRWRAGQTEAGDGALDGAFQFVMMCGLVALLLTQKDE